ncbi:quinone oxidoreductase-like protein 1 isoform X2 [Lingula anatina]|uniref:Quinone oxidoreductase-like protein 1 isoform X2 n=1 Tax=Lingula anatina TaxID=7574 RepID=A0A1S3JU92_LINAN|nr:quinone oxidoreductase-like protein 1 isoform X2 [Lingula anatina]|eukprot:XP_013413940.1 quinone oxidoreductase-like protein 1 isoform X2 [Lingula anatina]
MRGIFQKFARDEGRPQFTIDCPAINANSIKVQVKACALSLIDSKVLLELFKKTPQSEYPVGQEIAGIVIETGEAVTAVTSGDRVAGLLPLDSTVSGCGEFCVFHEYDVVKIPDSIEFSNAAATLKDGIKAYTALHYNAHVCSGDTVLILDGATSFGSMAVQLAICWGAKVLTTASDEEEKRYLESLVPAPAQVIELSGKSDFLVGAVLDETGGLGVDCVIDNGVHMFTSEEDSRILVDEMRHPLPSKYDIISSLAVGGRWVTSQFDLQLDPPNSEMLYLKGASVSYLFEHVWTMSAGQQGRYQHILLDLMDKVAHNVLRVNINKTVSFEKTVETLRRLSDIRIGKAVTLL